MESPVVPPDKFVSLDEDEAYAGTSYSDWRVLARETENFKTLKMEDIEPENQKCEICFEPFDPLEKPIQILSCGHIFGHVCLSNWLAEFRSNWAAEDPFWPRPPFSETSLRESDEKSEFKEAVLLTDLDDVSIALQDNGQRRRDWRDCLNWDSDDEKDLMPTSWLPLAVHDASCPKCRGKFSLVRSGEMGVMIKARVHFWDDLYEKLGISRSAKEEQSRTDLLRYVQMVELPRIEIQPEQMRSFTLQAQASAMRFAMRRGKRELDPLQTYLRDAIFNLGCYGLREGEYDATSYENRRVPVWCYKVDRIERGLSPLTVYVKQPDQLGLIPGTEEWNLVEYSKNFFREWKLQISGPWRRTLFHEVGGDRNGLRWFALPPGYHSSMVLSF
ncbi:hypothetical protein MMC22_012023 [Lobaria immixta]|nr:hypothetical protein [Lobaria immixta]